MKGLLGNFLLKVPFSFGEMVLFFDSRTLFVLTPYCFVGISTSPKSFYFSITFCYPLVSEFKFLQKFLEIHFDKFICLSNEFLKTNAVQFFTLLVPLLVVLFVLRISFCANLRNFGTWLELRCWKSIGCRTEKLVKRPMRESTAEVRVRT